MGGVVSGLLGGGQKPDASMQAAQEREAQAAKKRQDDLDAADEARKRANARGSGRVQLVGESGELGVSEDAGAGDGLKTKLGA
jgi:hypothetical protein